MANISLTSECNRACTYCFAAGQSAASMMSVETFARALDFLQRSGIDQARLLGGEPTLHPEFIHLAETALRRGLRVLVFTNGRMPQQALDWLAESPPGRVAVLLNATSPDAGQTRTLERLGGRVTLGFTIVSPRFEPARLLGLIREFHLSPCIRFGLAHPVAGGSNRFLHPRDYRAAGSRLAEFAEAARTAGVALSFDCGIVPCMFPTGAGAAFQCSPILDILPGGEVVSCYPLAALAREPLPEDETAAGLRHRFTARLHGNRRPWVLPDCVGCDCLLAGSCAGGCLAAAMRRPCRPVFERAHPRLPVFRGALGRSTVLYAPGHLAVMPGPPGEAPAELLRCAETAQAGRQRLADTAFAPECLTLYLNNRCNLACGYCYARHGLNGNAGRIDQAAALGAAELVIRCCARKRRPFHLVLHGGGEPTMEWESVVRLTAETRERASRSGVDWFGFLATNGLLSEERAAWLGRELDLVELSCDGPPDIQNRQRPMAGGGVSSTHVERTARVLRESGGAFVVRATITPETMERQAEIVAYLHEVLGASEMRFEPAYGLRRSIQPVFRPEQADRFVERFRDAQRGAAERGCNLTFSGSRLDEPHGPFCDVLRDTLHLLPDGSATACFFATDSKDPNTGPVIVGHWNSGRGEYVLDSDRIEAHRRKALRIPSFCGDCLNLLHCAGECPERCRVLDPAPVTPSFRCLVQRLLAETWILEAGEVAEHPSTPS